MGEQPTFPTDVIPTEVTARNEVEGSAVSQPDKKLGKQDDVIPTEATPTFDIQTIDFKKYDPRFKEFERLYLGSPDYGDRVRAAIRQIHQEEEQAWLAAGCPF